MDFTVLKSASLLAGVMNQESAHPFLPAFAPPVASGAPRQPVQSVARRRRPVDVPTSPMPSPPVILHNTPTRLQLTRLRLHLLRLTRLHSPEVAGSGTQPLPPTEPTERKRRFYTPQERLARSERLRAKWADPEWRAAMLARRSHESTVERKREAAKRLWADPDYRARMRASRLGRPAPNKGVPASELTRLRMSVARKGVPFSEERKRRMSAAKLNRPEGDDWPRRISEGKKGKTREYFHIRREFRALHHDLKLWSDSYRSRYGRLPSASTYERFVAPMMVFRIKRYLTLRDAIGQDEPDTRKEIISPH